MAFIEDRFPEALSFGATGGPERQTQIVTLRNGFEERNTAWSRSRRRYDVGTAVQSLESLELVTNFFEVAKGELYGFRFKDWTDFKSCRLSQTPQNSDQKIGTGDGSQTLFQLTKSYQIGDQIYAREITKPVAGTVSVSVGGTELFEGTDWALDSTTGVISLNVAPALNVDIHAGFEFDVPVRFASGALLIAAENVLAGQVPAIELLEIRER